jgi:DNA-binding CsgD family transcriptional regulator
MDRQVALAGLPGAAVGAMIRVTSSRVRRRWSYSLPLLLTIAATGLALMLGPGMASLGVFSILLLPVLAVALGLGLGPALATVAFGAVAGGVTLLGLAPGHDARVVSGEVALFAAEGATMAFVGAVVRAAIAAALRSAIPRDTAGTGQSPARPRLIEPLTTREIEVLRAAASGRSASELAAQLFVSTNTVKTHLAHCYDKLGAHNRAEAVALALQAGCLRVEDVEHAASAESPAGVTTGAMAVHSLWVGARQGGEDDRR